MLIKITLNAENGIINLVLIIILKNIVSVYLVYCK